MLVAKEQRLRYLKQQELRRQQQTASEGKKLQRLKKRGESPEAKLKKIRAMWGQVDYSKVINGNLSVEQVSSLFQEKQLELQTAVRRVKQLSLQLEELRRGKLNGLPAGDPGPRGGCGALQTAARAESTAGGVQHASGPPEAPDAEHQHPAAPRPQPV